MSLEPLPGVARALIGMVHLLPLPGSPRWGDSLEAVVDRAVADARALQGGGFHACLVENYGDAPFSPAQADPATVAAMAVVVTEVRRAARLAVGVNVLKNDARGALAVAAATGAVFIRVNVHVGAVVADQGVIQGDAYATLRYRRALGTDTRLFVDVGGKHAVPIAPVELGCAANVDRKPPHQGVANARWKPVVTLVHPRVVLPHLVGGDVLAQSPADGLLLAGAVDAAQLPEPLGRGLTCLLAGP